MAGDKRLADNIYDAFSLLILCNHLIQTSATVTRLFTSGWHVLTNAL